MKACNALACLLLLLPAVATSQTTPKWNPLAVDITRALVKDLFQSNAVPYIQPMVTTVNATSNARFYDRAYVPSGTSSFYVKVSVNGMAGVVQEKDKTYDPTFDIGPHVDVVTELAKYGKIVIIPTGVNYVINPTYQDTLGLSTMLMRELLRDAIDSNYLQMPSTAATLFGSMPNNQVRMPDKDELMKLLHNRTEYKAMGAGMQATMDSLLAGFALAPYLTLPPGANLATLIAAVPQVEIGSLYGTEMLLRFVPSVEFDRNVGKFSFWGVGLKHSLSQYFPERWFDLAVQAVYQGTSLTNTVGFTDSKLEADATIWSGNIHASKELWDCLDVYTGLAYERINVISTYTYVLPQEVQIGLGLLPPTNPGEVARPTAEQPGDTKPQQSVIAANNTNIKFTIGASVFYKAWRLAIDYNASQFDVVSAGLSYRF